MVAYYIYSTYLVFNQLNGSKLNDNYNQHFYSSYKEYTAPPFHDIFMFYCFTALTLSTLNVFFYEDQKKKTLQCRVKAVSTK